MPIQIVIDDVGWWSGRDGHAQGEPYRTGIPRCHVAADYEAIAYLGRSLNMRPQAALVLCEWDRDNLLRAEPASAGHCPSCTWMGRDWDTREWAGPWIEAAADILHRYADYIEAALHGIGHEYWEDGRMERAEWHDTSGRMRPRDTVLRHIELFGRLLSQHRIGPFPKSFVPAAFLHRFGGGGQRLAAILRDAGIRFRSTPFASMHDAAKTREARVPGNGSGAGDSLAATPEEGAFPFVAWDADVLTIDRGRDLCRWNDLAPSPEGSLSGPICGMHWPNILHLDSHRNYEVVDRWVAFLEPYGKRTNTQLATDTSAFCTQLVHHQYGKVKVEGAAVRVETAHVPVSSDDWLDPFAAVRIQTHMPVRFASKGLEIAGEKLISEQGGCLYEVWLSTQGPGRSTRITVDPLQA